jgi:hypothetical protein
MIGHIGPALFSEHQRRYHLATEDHRGGVRGTRKDQLPPTRAQARRLAGLRPGERRPHLLRPMGNLGFYYNADGIGYSDDTIPSRHLRRLARSTRATRRRNHCRSRRLMEPQRTAPVTAQPSERPSRLGLRWGQVLGTGSRISRDAQGLSREGRNEERNEQFCRESVVPSAFPASRGRRLNHGKEGVDGSSPSEGFGILPAQSPFPLSEVAPLTSSSVHRASTAWTSSAAAAV